MRKVLRSSELRAAAVARTPEGARIRRQAIAGTAAAPEFRRIEVEGQQLLVGRTPDGAVVAFAAYCPHQQTPLDNATFFEGRLRCPQHNYVYDVATGGNIVPTRDARPELMWKLRPGYLRIYPTEERDGWIWVSSEPLPPPVDFDPRREAGPAVSHRDFRHPDPAPPPEPSGPVEHPPEEMAAAAGAELDVELPTTFKPGHIWRVECDGDVVVVGGQTFEQGPPTLYRLHLSAARPGRASVRCTYCKPWGAGVKEIRTFVVVVT